VTAGFLLRGHVWHDGVRDRAPDPITWWAVVGGAWRALEPLWTCSVPPPSFSLVRPIPITHSMFSHSPHVMASAAVYVFHHLVDSKNLDTQTNCSMTSLPPYASSAIATWVQVEMLAYELLDLAVDAPAVNDPLEVVDVFAEVEASTDDKTPTTRAAPMFLLLQLLFLLVSSSASLLDILQIVGSTTTAAGPMGGGAGSLSRPARATSAVVLEMGSSRLAPPSSGSAANVANHRQPRNGMTTRLPYIVSPSALGKWAGAWLLPPRSRSACDPGAAALGKANRPR
jgi:hypothetical protein